MKKDIKFQIRMTQKEYDDLVIKSKGVTLSKFVRDLIFNDSFVKLEVKPKVVPIMTPYPFPYDDWKIVPNPENGKKEPVLVDEGMNYAVSIVSPTGKQMLIREGEMFYKEIWEKLK